MIITASGMIDIQSTAASRKIRIDRVGVSDLRYPIKVLERDGSLQATIADIELGVDLSPKYRGTHMSRFVEIIDRYSGQELTISTIPELLKEVCVVLESKTAEIDIRFPYFLRKQAPVSRKEGLVNYSCRFHGRLDGTVDFMYGLSAPITSLCPCSKEISDHGAHNQRAEVTVEIRSVAGKLVWFEELIGWIEGCASSPAYSILKREDERFVTEQAYDNPAFVEDIVRSLAEILNDDKRITWYNIHAESYESIHNHNAFASIICSKEQSLKEE